MGRPFQEQMEFETAIVTAKQTASSGVFTGGTLRINVVDTTYDVSSGSGVIINDSDPNNPISEIVTWNATVGAVPAYAANKVTYVLINSLGSLVNSINPPTNEDYRSKIVLGAVFTQNGVNINAVSNIGHKPSTYVSSDISRALGNINISGNSIVNATTNLTITKESGFSFNENSNRNVSADNPHVTTDAADVGATFRYIYSDGLGGYTPVLSQTNIDPNQYDDGTGTLASVAAGKYTNQLIYFSPLSKEITVQYGKKVFDSLAEAQAEASNIPVLIDPNIGLDLIRTVLCVKSGATDLSIAADAFFYKSGKFGIGVDGSGIPSSSTDLQLAYDNSSAPQITTSAAKGEFQIKRGTAADADAVLAIQNGAGSNVATLYGDGNADFSSTVNAVSGFKTNGTEGNAYASNRNTAVDTITTATDYIIGVTDTAIPRTITLGTATKNTGSPTRARFIIIKDISGGATANNITIDTESGLGAIDGVASVSISVDYGVLIVYTDGTNWFST